MNESDEYKRGWYDGYQAAKEDKTKIYQTQPLGPAKTMDIQWPDRIPTTMPFPPNHYSNVCTLCKIDLNKATHYVCSHPNCTSQIKVTC